jgi:hypothetical protein
MKQRFGKGEQLQNIHLFKFKINVWELVDPPGNL